ncbi:MAG: CbiQ family ECF transporter T component [Roseiflexaceae bacterium]|nr:CbiQ family ECF transporter T component [Roseiflexaceae bacterium]
MNAAPLHPFAWIAWLAAVCAVLSATRNPLHLGLALLCVLLVTITRGLRPGVLRLAIGITLVAAFFNLILARVGATVLWRIPGSWPLLSGPLTLESLVYGALTGLALAGIFTAFGAAQGAVPTRALLDLLPPAFAPLAITLTIAVAFVPATLRQLRQVREAQLIRGHTIRGLRDWSALLIPLLIGGLDRALQMAEALAARGFPDQAASRRSPAILIAIGLALLAAGLLINAWGTSLLGWALTLLGLGIIGLAIWLAGRNTPRTRYRRLPWTHSDTLVAIAALVAGIAFVVPFALPDRAVLAFSPYPQLAFPLFSPIHGIATLGLSGPGVVLLLASGE